MGLKRSTAAPTHPHAQPDERHGTVLLDQRGHARDLDGLIARLVDNDPHVRRWAARDLAAEPGAATALCSCLAVEADANVRSALFSSIARLGGDVVVQAMLALLRCEDAGLRNGAIEVLAGLPDAVAPHIDALLVDADSDVRIFAVNLMADLRHAMVPTWLAQVLLRDSAVNVVAAAIEVLAEVGQPAALPALRSARSRFAQDAFIGFAADLAIARIEAS
jgi:HEAT repeat protein